MKSQVSSRCRSLQAAATQHGLQPTVALRRQQLPRALAVRQAMPTMRHVQHQHQHQQHNTCSVFVCRAGHQAAFYSSTEQQRRRDVVCCAGKSSGDSTAKKQQAPADVSNNMDDMEDIIMVEASEEEEDENDIEDDGFVDFDADEDVISDEDADFEGEDDGDVLGLGLEEDPGPEVLTGNVEWGDKALAVAQAALDRPENSNLALYLFRVLVPNKTIEIRLDKLDDAYGSPGLEDIERFSRALSQGLEAELGVEAAGEVSFEVSTPGAERTLILPQDLLRFKELPMRVEYMTDVGVLQNTVMTFLELDELNGKTTWELADVKANQNVKGRGLSKKQRMQRYDISLEALERVRIYVDF